MSNEITLQNKVDKLIEQSDEAIYKAISDNALYLHVVNTPAKKEWLKPHPTAKGVNYLPIDKVEFLLTAIHQEWHVEILEVSQLLNSIMVRVRLFYKLPHTGKFKHQDGVGAVGVQTDSGAKASDMTAIKNDAVMKAAPAAESYAIKDAAEKIGKIFGSDINRKDTFAFYDMYSSVEDKKKQLLENMES